MRQPAFKFSQETIDTVLNSLPFVLIEEEDRDGVLVFSKTVASFSSYADAVGFALDRVLSTKKCVHVYWVDARRVAITVWPPAETCVEYGKED